MTPSDPLWATEEGRSSSCKYTVKAVAGDRARFCGQMLSCISSATGSKGLGSSGEQSAAAADESAYGIAVLLTWWQQLRAGSLLLCCQE